MDNFNAIDEQLKKLGVDVGTTPDVNDTTNTVQHPFADFDHKLNVDLFRAENPNPSKLIKSLYTNITPLAEAIFSPFQTEFNLAKNLSTTIVKNAPNLIPYAK